MWRPMRKWDLLIFLHSRDLRGHLSLVDIMTEKSSSEKTAGASIILTWQNDLIFDFFLSNWGPYELTETNSHA